MILLLPFYYYYIFPELPDLASFYTIQLLHPANKSSLKK